MLLTGFLGTSLNRGRIALPFLLLFWDRNSHFLRFFLIVTDAPPLGPRRTILLPSFALSLCLAHQFDSWKKDSIRREGKYKNKSKKSKIKVLKKRSTEDTVKRTLCFCFHLALLCLFVCAETQKTNPRREKNKKKSRSRFLFRFVIPSFHFFFESQI